MFLPVHMAEFFHMQAALSLLLFSSFFPFLLFCITASDNLQNPVEVLLSSVCICTCVCKCACVSQALAACCAYLHVTVSGLSTGSGFNYIASLHPRGSIVSMRERGGFLPTYSSPCQQPPTYIHTHTHIYTPSPPTSNTIM